MKRSCQLAALCLYGLGLATSCATRVRGQLMLAVQTDMSLPKDIDWIRITVTYPEDGATIVALNNDYSRFGEADANKLPGTVTFRAPSDPSAPVRIQVSGSRGGPEASPRVLRDVVTSVPEDRVATLPVNLEFLCNGTTNVVYDSEGNIKRDPTTGNVVLESTCGEGLTCVAGRCVTPEVPSENLPDYKEEEIFGGGSGEGDGVCFDTATCFEDGAPVELTTTGAGDTATCEGSVTGEIAGGDFNIALRTQGGGICGSSDCFVALDAADSEGGWKKISADGKIQLPLAVCEKVQSGQLLGVVAAPVGGATCQQKRPSIPTCGPWSSTGQDIYAPPPQLDATILAPGQATPFSIAVDGANSTLYWVTRGTYDPMGGEDKTGAWNADGAVKAVSIDGGEPVLLAEKQYLPHSLALDTDRYFVLWTASESLTDPDTMVTTQSGRLMVAPFLEPGKAPPIGEPLLVLNAHGDPAVEPAGIAVQDLQTGPTRRVAWTEPNSQNVYSIDTIVNEEGKLVPASDKMLPPGISSPPPGEYPTAIAALDSTDKEGVVCWAYRDSFGTTDGVVACSGQGTTLTVATGQATPQTIVLTLEPRAVYWTNFAAKEAGGGIFKVNLPDSLDSGQPPGALETVEAEDYPGGLAVDGTTVYWTSRGRGAVLRKRDDVTQELISNQKNPGAIAVHQGVVCWANEGTGAVDGAILRAVLPD
jgi:hypothetical protein